MLAEIAQYKHNLPILSALKKGEKMNMSEVAKASNINNRNTLMRSIDHLEELGLVDSEYTSSWPLQRFVWLTEKGKKVASVVLQLEEVLKQE